MSNPWEEYNSKIEVMEQALRSTLQGISERYDGRLNMYYRKQGTESNPPGIIMEACAGDGPALGCPIIPIMEDI